MDAGRMVTHLSWIIFEALERYRHQHNADDKGFTLSRQNVRAVEEKLDLRRYVFLLLKIMRELFATLSVM